MKYAVLIARILLGFVFVFFGINSVLHFLPQQMPPGDAGLFLNLLATHKYMNVVALLMIIGGVLLLVGRFVPLGLVLLAPVIVNIFLFHALFEPSGLPIAFVVVILELFLIFAYRYAFAGIFSPGPEAALRPKF